MLSSRLPSIRPLDLSDTALRLTRAGVLRPLRYFDLQLWGRIDQRFGRVVADQSFLAVSVAHLIAVRHIDRHFNTRQILWQRFITLLLFLPLMRGNSVVIVVGLFVVNGLLQSVRGVADFGGCRQSPSSAAADFPNNLHCAGRMPVEAAA